LVSDDLTRSEDFAPPLEYGCSCSPVARFNFMLFSTDLWHLAGDLMNHVRSAREGWRQGSTNVRATWKQGPAYVLLAGVVGYLFGPVRSHLRCCVSEPVDEARATCGTQERFAPGCQSGWCSSIGVSLTNLFF